MKSSTISSARLTLALKSLDSLKASGSQTRRRRAVCATPSQSDALTDRDRMSRTWWYANATGKLAAPYQKHQLDAEISDAELLKIQRKRTLLCNQADEIQTMRECITHEGKHVFAMLEHDAMELAKNVVDKNSAPELDNEAFQADFEKRVNDAEPAEAVEVLEEANEK